MIAVSGGYVFYEALRRVAARHAQQFLGVAELGGKQHSLTQRDQLTPSHATDQSNYCSHHQQPTTSAASETGGDGYRKARRLGGIYLSPPSMTPQHSVKKAAYEQHVRVHVNERLLNR